jgi:hypothetical protein
MSIKAHIDNLYRLVAKSIVEVKFRNLMVAKKTLDLQNYEQIIKIKIFTIVLYSF